MELTEQQKQYIINLARLAHSYGFVPIPMRGKAPIVRGWQKYRNNLLEDTNDIAQGRHPKRVRQVSHLLNITPASKAANSFGIVTGEASGIVVFDIDVKDNGIAQWNQLVDVNGEIPRTFMVHTGEGGYHYYFKYAPYLANIGNMNSILDKPIDYRTNNGVIVFPGNTSQKTGNQYVIIDGYDNNVPLIADMPGWLIGLLIQNNLYRKGITSPTQEQFREEQKSLGIP